MPAIFTWSCPLYGLAEIPDHLRELLIEAPYHAAEQVFETALAEDVDAVLLAGDVLNVDRAGPPAIVLLLDQFARLGRTRDSHLLGRRRGRCARLLAAQRHAARRTCTCFPVGRVESLDLARAGETIARVQGTSCPEGGTVDARGFHRDAHGLFTIGVAHGTNDSAGHEGDRVHYMALGGRHLQQTVDEQPGIAHYCGTPQGRGPNETGPHGCTVVTVDETHRAKTQVRRHRYGSLDRSSAGSHRHDEVKSSFTTAWSSGWKSCRPSTRAIDLFVRWNIRGTGPLVNRLRPNSLADELLVDLRRQFGERSPVAWSASITCDSPLSVPAEWYDQETCLGDFLRVVRDFELHETPFDLRPFLPENVRDEFLESHRAHRCRRSQQRTAVPRLEARRRSLTLPLEEGDIPAN